MTKAGTIAIVGSGMIGQSWAICFLRAGYAVRLFDHVAGAAGAARDVIAAQLQTMAGQGLLDDQPVGAALARLSCGQDLAGTVDGVAHVQENTPEHLDLKRAIFAELDAVVPQGVVIASSTSALLPSAFSGGLAGQGRCLVVHPLNPPHLIPAVEIVPAPQTAPWAVAATRALMAAIGQHPVVVQREVEGFVMNRLQGALLDEAFALVAEGYATPEDVDTALRDGLARRWAFMGPFETIDLNAPGGIADFIARYGPAYAEIGRNRPGRVDWNGPVAQGITDARRAVLPMEQHAARQAWRNRQLAALARHFLNQDKE